MHGVRRKNSAYFIELTVPSAWLTSCPFCPVRLVSNLSRLSRQSPSCFRV